MTIIFIECGTSLNSPFNTGIQRVVRNIVRESEMVGTEIGHQCIKVFFDGKNFRRLGNDSATDKPHHESWAKRSFNLLKDWYRLARPHISNRAHQQIVYIVNAIQRLFNKWGRSEKESPTIKQMSLAHRKVNHQVKLDRPILLLLDSSWDMRIWPAINKFRASGGTVSAVLYDLIPFSHPDTVEEHTRNAHTEWWLEAPMHIDSVICISKTVRAQYLLWQDERHIARRLAPAQVKYFYLGSELVPDGSGDAVQMDLTSSKVPYFLSVGSIEPRKNHALILDALDELWSQGIFVNLVIVGSYGWKSEAFLERVANHPMLDKQLFLLRRTTDAELTHLYSKTAGLIIASIAEGFGLPIVEAFQRGAQVICSDIPVFREIAGQRAVYFDPKNHTELVSKIRMISQNTLANPSTPRDKASWLTWRESTAQLLHQLVH